MTEDAGFFDLLKALIRHPSVVGNEHAFFQVLQRELEERGATVTWYEGLLVAQGRDPSSVTLSAHIDRHGLVCTGPNEFQYAAFIAGERSDLLGNSVSEQMMLKVASRYDGLPVYAYEPWSGSYLGHGQVGRTFFCEKRDNLVFEIAELRGLVAGTPVAFQDNLKQTGNELSGQLDNVLSAAILVDLFEHEFEGTTLFTAQEESGKSWRYLAEWFRRFGGSTSKFIALDTSPFPDGEDAGAQDIVLRRKDANAAFDPDLTSQIEDYCTELGISFIYKDTYIEAQNRIRSATGENLLSLGSTEMGRIIASAGSEVTGTTVQIPTTGYHTMEETTSIEACRSYQRLLLKIAHVGT